MWSPLDRHVRGKWRHHRGYNQDRSHGGLNDTIGHCANLASNMLAKKIQPILKTGAKEHSNKLLAHLDTVSSCIAPEDLLIFSDLQDYSGPYTIHDALDRLSASTTRQNPDFDIYRQQKALRYAGEGLEDLDAGWTLDKYKFLPMVQKAWHLKPERNWYIFFETDTYVFWKNLVEFLSHFDPEKTWYMGSPVWPADGSVVFAHGGSGFVLSKAAMRRLNSETPDGLVGGYEYGVKVVQWCCGDQVLAAVLQRKGIRLRGYWPMFNGEKPSTLSFDDEFWCHPILTFHHLSSSELAELWAEEQSWIPECDQYAEVPETVLTFEGLFQSYIFTSLLQAEERVHWDYRAEDDSSELTMAAASMPECRSLCEKEKTCLQYRFRDGEGVCGLSDSVRLGETLEAKEGEETVRSGWMSQRIAKWMERRECRVIKWVRANP